MGSGGCSFGICVCGRCVYVVCDVCVYVVYDVCVCGMVCDVCGGSVSGCVWCMYSVMCGVVVCVCVWYVCLCVHMGVPRS